MQSKLIRLIEYLSALAKINASIVRSCDDYHKLLWTHDIPHEPKYCFCRAWGEDENYSDDIWLEIKKFPEPKLPPIPKSCEDWINPASLRNINEIPSLRSTITLTVESRVATGEVVALQETRNLTDFPSVQKAWDDYLEQQWLTWTEIYRRYLAVQKIYAGLFGIYQEQQKLGEQYELVFCLGLLNWRQPNGHAVKRHLIVAKASLEFEAELGKFTVRASADGDQTEVEFDMLEVDFYPQNSISLIDCGRKIRDNLWDRNEVDALLKAIANSLADQGQGQYYPEALKPEGGPANDTPRVEFAPALVLRKRSMRGLIKFLEDMRKQVEEGAQPPSEFLDICESATDKVSENSEHNQGRTPPPSEIYFPLLANEQQLQIIRKLDVQRGVLVQGPPGTGKSHTIANLICHLLASGQRVLVTAKTPRALQVLHDKIPESVRPLCISLLGSGTEERESLERSVNGILANLDRRDELRSAQRIADIESRLRENRAAKAECDQKIIAVRERETFEHAIADGVYRGTAANIAGMLRAEEPTYCWLSDQIGADDELPLTHEEIRNLSQLSVEIDKKTEKELSCYLPDSSNEIPSCDQLRGDFRREKELQCFLKSSESRIATPEGLALSLAPREHVSQVQETLGRLSAETANVRRRPMAWAVGAVKDVLTDLDTPWKELLRLSLERTNGLKTLAEKVQYYTVNIPIDMDRKKLIADAQVLKGHFEAGGKTKEFLFFKNKVIKKHGEMIDRVKVEGLDCADPATLQKLIDYLAVEQKLNEAWALWKGKASCSSEQFLLQLAEIDELHEALKCVLGLYDLRENVRASIEKVSGLSSPRFEEVESLNDLSLTCQAVLAKIDLDDLNKQLDKEDGRISTIAARGDAHPICADLLAAYRERNLDRYCQVVDMLDNLTKKVVFIKNKRAYIGRLASKAPKLAGELAQNDNPLLSVERLDCLEKAWAWRRACSWLTDFLQLDSVSLERNGKRLEDEIRKDLAELASLKAWLFCFSRMASEQQRHLMAWQQAMRKLGKGTGKHAHTHRLNAQRHLNECKEAVPAWIMPLHRVYETVECGPGVFDVIIVDEASQCGPESLPLMYLGQKIIVVGDEKQISPEAVGIDRSQVQGLMRTYLSDFVHSDSFDVENSLFAHGRIRFGNRITLREHFRCMPEIIRFSNDLCYTSDPLIPLRQYPPDRLEPLKAVYVQNGFREGSGQRVINRPEAEALVAKLIECCQDERYQGMTMGVIVLQGDAQAGIIEDLLLKKLGAEEMQKRRIICGNPYTFQGDERDAIFLSMVAAPNENFATLTKETDMRRFNVAASRAQEQMWLFHSITNNHISEQCYRRKLLNHFSGLKPQQISGVDVDTLRGSAYSANRMQERQPSPFDSWFEVDVALAIAGRGYRIIPQFEFAGKFIDLVVQGNKPQLAVECDGDKWHGRDAYEADMVRQRMLERCGWHFFRIRSSRYYANPENALDPLWSQLEKMGIYPENQHQSQDSEHAEHEEHFGDEEDVNGEDRFEGEKEPDSSIEQPPLPLTSAQDWSKMKEAVNRLDVMRYSSSHQMDAPTTIQEALTLKPKGLCGMIIEVLKARPNNSCVRENMPTYILKEWNIRTRGTPRDAFAKKVDDQIAIMVRKGYLVAYRSVNDRIKLGWNTYSDEK